MSAVESYMYLLKEKLTEYIKATHHAQCLALIETKFSKHLVPLLHHECSFVGVRRNIAVHLQSKSFQG